MVGVMACLWVVVDERTERRGGGRKDGRKKDKWT
jgi:hypothetical protein